MHSSRLSQIEKQRTKRRSLLRQLACSLGPSWNSASTTSTTTTKTTATTSRTARAGHHSRRLRLKRLVVNTSTRSTSATASFSATSPSVASNQSPRSRAHPGALPQRKRRQERRDEQRLSEAAHASRLPAHGLSIGEFEVFQHHLCRSDMESYLRTRNTMLWLWRESPREPLTLSRAVEATQGYGLHHGLVVHIFEFLLRSGYINFGACPFQVDSSRQAAPPSGRSRRTIGIIGSGIAGVAVAKQLENLFHYFAGRFAPDLPPRVVVLEARSRVGGRMHSMQLGRSSGHSADQHGSNSKHAVDLGAQIITGFDDGNPMEVIIRRQLLDLGLHYLFNETCDLFDHKGRLVSKPLDVRCEAAFNQILGEACLLREMDKLPSQLKDYLAMRAKKDNRSPGRVLSDTLPTLGHSMDFFLESHPEFKSWTHSELELVHWHYANLEFANATPLDQLSLRHWDQDDGYEFSGPHSMVVQGYGQVPEMLSKGLDIRLDMPVTSVRRQTTPTKTSPVSHAKSLSPAEPVRIQCRDGSTLDCTIAVVTVPLGVLKSKQISFSPPLPSWKERAIAHLGFGLLNKLVLVFDKPFWDPAVELFGYVASGQKGLPTKRPDLRAYRSSRGKFYMFWNCMAVSGLPVLVTLMAGQSAYDCEQVPKEDLVKEAMETLALIYPQVQPMPVPIETVVTRWSQDEFARGSYSFVGREGSGEDYDLLAKPVDDQIYFAGEATSRKYPATAHGAYLSGLDVSKHILDALIGPQVICSGSKANNGFSRGTGAAAAGVPPPEGFLQHDFVIPRRKGRVPRSMVADFVAELSDGENVVSDNEHEGKRG